MSRLVQRRWDSSVLHQWLFYYLKKEGKAAQTRFKVIPDENVHHNWSFLTELEISRTYSKCTWRRVSNRGWSSAVHERLHSDTGCIRKKNKQKKTLNWIFGPFRVMGLHKQNKMVCTPLKNRCVTKNIQEGLQKSKRRKKLELSNSILILDKKKCSTLFKSFLTHAICSWLWRIEVMIPIMTGTWVRSLWIHAVCM